MACSARAHCMLPSARHARMHLQRAPPMPTWRLSAKEVALFTRPSISAPEKFLVRAASSARSTSRPRNELVLILLVWICRGKRSAAWNRLVLILLVWISGGSEAGARSLEC